MKITEEKQLKKSLFNKTQLKYNIYTMKINRSIKSTLLLYSEQTGNRDDNRTTISRQNNQSKN